MVEDKHPGLDPDKYYFVLGIGDPKQPETINFHYVDHRRAGRTLVLFSSQEEAERFIETNLETPEAYMDMLESGGLRASQALREGKHLLMPFKIEDVAAVALRVEADSLLLDPRPGENPTMRLPKPPRG